MSWQPRVDKSGPLFWNTVTFHCILELPKTYGVPYDWVCLRKGRTYRYSINTETLNRSGETLYAQLQQKRSVTLAAIRRHKVLLRNLRTAHQKLLRADIRKLNRRQLHTLFTQTLAAHVPANGFIFFGSIIDTWADQLERMLRENVSASHAKRMLIILLTHEHQKISSFKFSKQIRLIANIIREVGRAMFELREQIETNRTIFAPVLEDIRRRMGITPSNWEHVSWKHIEDFLTHGKLPSKAEIRANAGTSFFAVVNGEKMELHGAAAKQQYAQLIGENNVSQTKILRGTCASSGKTSGRVRIIRDVNDFPRFREGCVLVTFMTMPSYISIMRKAAAIITEVGGITSHAAVVSRELGKPCIVGVRNATRLLKTGERVDIDADRGIIAKQR